MFDQNDLPKVTVYSDGGCSPNPGFGAWAVLLMFQRESGEVVRKELTGYNSDTTNNQMELTAAIQALEALNTACEVDFYTDSTYLKNGVTKWMKGWLKNNWRTSAYQPDGKGGVRIVPTRPVENQKLWKRLHTAIQSHRIHCHWVRGHADDENNNYVDKLVNLTRDEAKGKYKSE